MQKTRSERVAGCAYACSRRTLRNCPSTLGSAPYIMFSAVGLEDILGQEGVGEHTQWGSELVQYRGENGVTASPLHVDDTFGLQDLAAFATLRKMSYDRIC